jgi:serine/threonine protein phosphatase PrpC
MQLEVSVLTDAGGRARNEDAYGFWSGGGGCFCVVSDGAGGHGAGDVASKLAVRVVLASFQDDPQCTGTAITHALANAHRAILGEQATAGALADMRATATVLAIDTVHHLAAWGHVGDTRLYCFRAHKVVAQTKDHSVVQRLVDAGYLKPEATRESTERSRLFAALGHDGENTASVGATDFAIAGGDQFLLCTDGFWEYIDESAMEATLVAAVSPADWLRRMEEQVRARGGPEQDNFSALAVWCTDLDQPRPTTAN